jgi:hypothetical protein
MFWSRRAKHKEVLTKMPVAGPEEVVYGISQWDWTPNNPFLAGLIAFVATQAVNDLGMVMQNDNGATLAYAHLYNYLPQIHTGYSSKPTSVLEEEWTDIMSLFKLVGDAGISRVNDRRQSSHDIRGYCYRMSHRFLIYLRLRAATKQRYGPKARSNSRRSLSLMKFSKLASNSRTS